MTTCHWPQLCEDTVENHSIDRRRPGQIIWAMVMVRWRWLSTERSTNCTPNILIRTARLLILHMSSIRIRRRQIHTYLAGERERSRGRLDYLPSSIHGPRGSFLAGGGDSTTRLHMIICSSSSYISSSALCALRVER